MPERSTTVTPELLRGMVRATAFVRLTTRTGLVVLTAAAVLLVLGVVLVLGPETRGSALTPLVMGLALAVLFPLLVLRSTRRALSAALPVGSVVSVDVRDETLHVATARGASDARYDAYRSVVERGSVVLLHLRGSQIVNVVPRELLDADDLVRLRRRITATVTAP